MREDYGATREAVRDVLTKYGPAEVKTANKEMRKIFGNRFSQVRPVEDTCYAYYILVKEDDEWELDRFDWDFWYHNFA